MSIASKYRTEVISEFLYNWIYLVIFFWVGQRVTGEELPWWLWIAKPITAGLVAIISTSLNLIRYLIKT